MDNDLFDQFDSSSAKQLSSQVPQFEEQDGLGGMHNFHAERGYKHSGNAKVVMDEEHLRLPKNMPFDLEALEAMDKPKSLADLEAAGANFIERPNGVPEINLLQMPHSGLNVDALLQSRQDLRTYDGRGVYIQFESSDDAENKFNDVLAKDLEISKYGSNKFLNEDQIDFKYFPKKRPADAEEAVQVINSIVDAGDDAEKQLEEDTAASEAAGEAEAIQLRMIPDLLSDAEFARRTAAKHHKGAISSKFGGEVSNVLSGIIDDGEAAEEKIYSNAFPEAAKIRSSKRVKAQKRATKDEGSVDLTSVEDYDASDVQIQFAEQNLDAVNDELAEANKIKKMGQHGYLIDGELAMKHFTYFPQVKGLTDGAEGADELKQFLNSVGDAGDVAEESLEAATAEGEAA